MMTVQKSLLEDQTAIVKMISSGMPMEKVLRYILKSIRKYGDPNRLYGSFMLYNPLTNQLGKTVSPSLPASFISALEPVNVSLYGGASGTAAFLKQPVLVSDIERNPLSEELRHIALSHGFRACWASPILSSTKELLGTIQLYSTEIGSIDEETLKIVDVFSELASLAIEISKNNDTLNLHSIEIDNRHLRKNEANEKFVNELYTALEKEQFEVYYHPYFGKNEKILGVEALIRWNHPELGLLSPAAFLPVAEETGFILELEKWVLTQSISNMNKLTENGWTDLALSVNISAQQFDNPHFPDMVAELLERSSFHPNNLTIEVTERFLIHKDNIDIFNRLKATGIKLSIDDFGTCYSSLQYLKDLHFDEIKIDRSFISNLESDHTSQKIVEMVIALAHQLNLNIVAEGVETEAQHQLLKEMNCKSMQGFLFSKPISFHHLVQFIAAKELVE